MAVVREPNPQAGPAPAGFSAKIQGASLGDLVQLECLSRAACVMRVTATDGVGYLYFRSGRIVHAVSASNVGEAAALEILSWTTGSFEACNAGWPAADTIHTPVQALLLRAAQARDESGRPNLVQFRRTRTDAPVRLHEEQSAIPERPRTRAFEPTRPPPPARATALTHAASSASPTAIRAAVRLEPNGTLISSHGTGAEDLAAAAALAARQARLVGEAFGLDQLLAIECAGEQLKTLIVVESNAKLVAIRTPSDADLNAVRDRYGL